MKAVMPSTSRAAIPPWRERSWLVARQWGCTNRSRGSGKTTLAAPFPSGRHVDLLRTTFPETFGRREVEEFVSAINEVRPSFIRTEADEVTYNLHIIIRFELEQGLISGEIDVDHLPHLWNQKYHDYLGIVPPTDTLGVLQDIHWSGGSFGYFPTYTLGNLYGAQIYHKLRQVFPDFDERLATEGTAFILNWLREQMYAYGKTYTPDEVIRSMTGEALNPEYFVQYANAKFGALYGLNP